MDWLQELKPGDKALVREGRSDYNQRTAVTVVKVTRTQIVLENDRRFHRDSGQSLAGGDWHRSYLEQATPEACEALALQERMERQAQVWRKVGYYLHTTKPPTDAVLLEKTAAVLSRAYKEVKEILL